MSAPREIDRADVLSTLVDRWAETAGHSTQEEPGARWVLDQLAQLGHLSFLSPVDEVGVIRAVNGKPRTAVRVGTKLSPFPSSRAVWVIVETGEVLPDGAVAGLGEVVGSVPNEPDWDGKTVAPTPVTLLVHPYMWKTVVAYLSSLRIQVSKVSRSAEDPVYDMRPASGKWGG